MTTAQQDPVVIVGAARTPMGGFMGDFASLAAHDLGGVAISAVRIAGITHEFSTIPGVREDILEILYCFMFLLFLC